METKYTDTDLIDRLVADIEEGASFPLAFAAQGLARSTWSKWLERAEKPGADPALVGAVNRLSRARALAAVAAEKAVLTGDSDHRGKLAWLERMEREVWGRAVQVDLGGPDGNADADALLQKLLGAASASAK